MHTSTSGLIPLEELASLPDFYRSTLSPDRRFIAFYGNKSGRMELYVIEARPGAQPRQISNGQMPLSPRAGFCWTRDNQFIIYAKDHDGDEKHNLWSINLHTGAVEQLTNNPHAQEYPIEVTPDNKRVLVFSNLNGQLQLYSFDLESRTYTQLTDYKFPVLAFSSSPDGTLIAYITNETSDFKNRDLYVMNSEAVINAACFN